MVERGYGRIVNVASIAGKEGNPMAAAYSAAKAAVIAMTKSIGKDVARHRRARQLHRARGDRDADARRAVRTTTSTTWSSASRSAAWASADEVAALACWLASEECSFSTGATFDISGGRAVY